MFMTQCSQMKPSEMQHFPLFTKYQKYSPLRVCYKTGINARKTQFQISTFWEQAFRGDCSHIFMGNITVIYGIKKIFLFISLN